MPAKKKGQKKVHKGTGKDKDMLEKKQSSGAGKQKEGKQALNNEKATLSSSAKSGEKGKNSSTKAKKKSTNVQTKHTPKKKTGKIGVEKKQDEPKASWIETNMLTPLRNAGDSFRKAVSDQYASLKKSIKKGVNVINAFFDRVEVAVSVFFNSTGWKTFTRVLKTTFYSVCAVILVVFIVLLSASYYFHDKILPNTYIAGVQVGTLSQEQALEQVRELYTTFADESFVFDFEGKQYKLSLEDLLIKEEIDTSISTAFWYGHTENHFLNQKYLISSFFARRNVPIVFDYKVGILQQQMEMFVEEISVPAKDAEIMLDETGSFAIVPSKESTTTDFQIAYNEIIRQLDTLKAQSISLPSLVAKPEITDEEAERVLEKSQAIQDKIITVVYDAHHKVIVPYVIDIADDKAWLAFKKEDGSLQVELDENRLKQVMNEELAPQVNQAHHDAIITMPTEGEKYATLDSAPSDGFTLDAEQSFLKIQDTLWHDSTEPVVELSVSYKEGIIMDKDGNDVGLRDLLGVGKSNFDGSSSSRIFNVEKGLGLFNNMILAPGDEFSFNEILGSVTLSNGWKAELAIFDGGYDTRPVAGGGLCQVSTTMYRAVVESGLKVVERRPHSYLVSYYVKDSDPRTGIDATIYPGSQDLRFVNDTPGFILIQTYTDGNDAYIKFYGTSDGRTVALDGPYKSGWYGPGPAKLTPTPDLAPGEVKITHAQHLGRTITWYQTITFPDNTEEKITINSNYKAIPAQGLIGSGVEPLASE